jgi:ComF family protein
MRSADRASSCCYHTRVNHGSLIAALSKLGRGATKIVLPSACVACGEELPWRDRVGSCCRRCWNDLPKITAPKCVRCGMPWEGAGELERYLCIACTRKRWRLGWIDGWGAYRGNLERVLHAFKFERHDFFDAALASLMEESLRARGDLAFDAVVAVPMHPRKVRLRGYNQAELLARRIAAALAIPNRPAMLRKVVEGSPQSTLPREERARNVRGAFAASSDSGGQRLLLVDDICTTGETLQACATALRRAGAKRVCAAVVARA